eukprot:35797-Eustigmatos_ZCMA.PRE.1
MDRHRYALSERDVPRRSGCFTLQRCRRKEQIPTEPYRIDIVPPPVQELREPEESRGFEVHGT